MWDSSVKVVIEAKGLDEIFRRLYSEKWTFDTTQRNNDIERDSRMKGQACEIQKGRCRCSKRIKK